MLGAKGQLSGADDSVCVCARKFVLGCACLCVHFNLFLFDCMAHVSFVRVCSARVVALVPARKMRSKGLGCEGTTVPRCPHCPLVMRMPLSATVTMVTAEEGAHALLV